VDQRKKSTFLSSFFSWNFNSLIFNILLIIKMGGWLKLGKRKIGIECCYLVGSAIFMYLS